MAKLALLIGISEYQPGLNTLPGAVQDMKAMQRVLQHSEMGDFAKQCSESYSTQKWVILPMLILQYWKIPHAK